MSDSVNPRLALRSEVGVYARQIDGLLEEFFAEELAVVDGLGSEARAMVARLREFCLRGGKRLRPYLVGRGYALIAGKEIPETIARAALVPELIHAFLLIHDDVMDQSEHRRGALTLHRQYEQAAAGQAGAGRLGESLAILSGDLLYALSQRLISRLPVAGEVRMRILDATGEAVRQTIFGQQLDLMLAVTDRPTVSQVLDMYRLKTAYYSFAAPLKIGALLAGASEEELASLTAYALPVGVAFQIRDDMLGLFGDEAKTGKSALSDVRAGKRTVLMLKALELATDQEQVALNKVLGNPKATEEDVLQVRRMVEDTGALIWCEDLIRSSIEQAGQALQAFSEGQYDQQVFQTLVEVAEFAGRRDR